MIIIIESLKLKAHYLQIRGLLQKNNKHICKIKEDVGISKQKQVQKQDWDGTFTAKLNTILI